ncbi:hypothetical protein JD969_17905 [Planctomycetota bacterium]|nr:hypothetical protein JD969_17905 [Planctomycetota bacterium]
MSVWVGALAGRHRGAGAWSDHSLPDLRLFGMDVTRLDKPKQAHGKPNTSPAWRTKKRRSRK